MQEENHCLASISKFGLESMESDKDHSPILLNYEPKTSVSMMIRRVRTQTFWRELSFWLAGTLHALVEMPLQIQ